MKTAKKLFALLLALAMALALSVTAFADGNNGSITIRNARVNETYTIYKLFDLTYSGENNENVAYTFTKTSTNVQFYNALTSGYTDHTDSPFILSATNTANVYNVTVKSTATQEDVISFLTGMYTNATNMIESVKLNSVKADSSRLDADGSTLTITGLEYGYYFVTSTTGSVVSISSASPNATIEDKNKAPGLTKQVRNVTAGETAFADSTSASIGQTVEFQITIHLEPTFGGVLLHDVMPDGLTLSGSISTKVGDGTNTKFESAVNVTSNPSDGDSFEVWVGPDSIYGEIAAANDDIVVTYQATVNTDAVIGGGGNVNKAKLTYGTDQSVEDEAVVYSYSFDLIKTGPALTTGDTEDYVTLKADGSVDSYYKKLTGAQFELYNVATGGTKINLVKVDGVENTYRVATTEEAQTVGFTSAVIEAGQATIQGLRAGSYWLEETKAPSGYNELTERASVTIMTGNVSIGSASETITNPTGGVHVVNNAGTVLPTTGGVGTTIFYVVGALLVVGAGVLLVTRKRMKDAE